MFSALSTAGLLDEFQSLAQTVPLRPAILAPGHKPLRLFELWTNIEHIARVLSSFGSADRNVVAAVIPDGADLMCAFLGALRAGVFAPLNPALTRPEFERTFREISPDVLIVASGMETSAAVIAGERNIPVLEIGLAEPGSAAGSFTFLNAAPARLPCPLPCAADPALLLHTSATTGTPKLVRITHGNLRATCKNSVGALGVGDSDRVLLMMPLFHLQGLSAGLLQLMVGGSGACVGSFDPAELWRWMDEFQPTWYSGGPTLHRAVLNVLKACESRPSLRFIRNIGAAMPETLAEEFEALGIRVVDGYGSTEAGSVTTTPRPPLTAKPGSAGVSVGPEIAIVDDSGAPMPAGAVGEIAVRGLNVVNEYLNDPEGSQRAFRNGWFFTGDLGRVDDDGFLFVLGRVKDMINRGGEKVLPEEVERALAQHRAIADAAAFGIPHPTLGEDVAVAVVVRRGSIVAAAELRRFAADHLANFKIPREIHFVEEIPKGPTGKPLRQRLTEHFAGKPQRDTIEDAPANSFERTLAAIWSRLLNSNTIGIHDDFFGIGGDSFSAVVLFTEIETQFGVTLDASEFLLAPTIATLANLLQTSRFCAPTVAGQASPLFFVPDAGESPFYLRHLARAMRSRRAFHILRDRRPFAQRGTYTIEEVAARLLPAMRESQAYGPYLLAGHCYGGVVAYELAQQLSALGEKVTLLAMFDTPAPDHPKPIHHWRQYGNAILGGYGFRLHETIDHLRFLRQRAVRKQEALACAGAPLTCAAANEAALRRYVPRPYDGRVTHFIANEDYRVGRVLTDSRITWQEFVRGRFDIRLISGNHQSMFQEPQLRQLVMELDAVMDSATAEAQAAAT